MVPALSRLRRVCLLVEEALELLHSPARGRAGDGAPGALPPAVPVQPRLYHAQNEAHRARDSAAVRPPHSSGPGEGLQEPDLLGKRLHTNPTGECGLECQPRGHAGRRREGSDCVVPEAPPQGGVSSEQREVVPQHHQSPLLPLPPPPCAIVLPAHTGSGRGVPEDPAETAAWSHRGDRHQQHSENPPQDIPQARLLYACGQNH